MQPTNKVQLVIAANQFLYRLGIKTMINVIGIEPELMEAESFEDVKTFLYEDKPDIFLIISEDILPNCKKDCFEEMKGICPTCKILFICENSLENFQPKHFILNSNNQTEVIDKFQNFFFKQDETTTNTKFDKSFLSDREVDVLKAVALGHSNKEIADILFISINTVITHRKNITEKLDIKSIAGLTVYALMNNLVKPEEVNI